MKKISDLKNNQNFSFFFKSHTSMDVNKRQPKKYVQLTSTFEHEYILNYQDFQWLGDGTPHAPLIPILLTPIYQKLNASEMY